MNTQVAFSQQVLRERVIVVTGAARGLGRAFSRGIVAAGGSVVMFDSDETALSNIAEAQPPGARVATVAGSVTDPAAVQVAIDAAHSEFGGLHGLVNNAAISHEASILDEDIDRVKKTLEVNVLGVILCTSLACRSIRQTGGSIVNISSASSLGLEQTSTYSGTKGAVNALTLSWAMELEPQRIRVNTLGPLAATAMGHRSSSPTAASLPAPDAIVPAVVWLLSDLSSGVAGQFLRFDGASLRVITNPRFKTTLVQRASWDVGAFDMAMRKLRPELEPYGLVSIPPPIARKGR